MVTTDSGAQGHSATIDRGSLERKNGEGNTLSRNTGCPAEGAKAGAVEAIPSNSMSGVTRPSGSGSDLAGLTNHVVNTLREWYVLASDSIANILEGRIMQQPSKDIWLLGKHYEATAAQQHDSSQGWTESYPPGFIEDFSHLIWCTYRSHYPPIAPSAFTTDAGWGCMLRAGQTLLAQALQLHTLGRDWGFSWESSRDEDRRRQYVGIIKQFFDDYTSTSIFSIHHMASAGRQFEGKDIGQWFGPHGTARIIHKLAREANHELNVYTTMDGVVYLADICADEFRPTLILVTSMLGIDRVNPVYYPFIQVSLTLPQSVGIAGGKPSSALYFSGFQGDELFYLDPHYTRQAIVHRNDDAYTAADLATYSCNSPRRIPLSRLDPCMVFGYYCGTLDTLIDLRSRIDLLADDGMKTLVAFDNGHSPEAAALAAETTATTATTTAGTGDCTSSSIESEDSSRNTIAIPKGMNSHAGGPLMLLSRSDSESSGVNVASSPESSVEHRSEGSDIVLEGGSGSGEEDWVTDL
ncbi:Cysteine protease atg4 [Coemansia sp. RSA 1804]|nr:Cysteine protease atg4 [Coemansia sp. RSA 1804]